MSELQLRREGISWTDVDGEVVALDEAAAVYLSANETGGMLWRALADGTSHDELVALLADTYGLTSEQAATDIQAFLTELREHGLLAA